MLDREALLGDDLAGVLEAVRKGTETQAHGAFVQELKRAAGKD